VQSQAQPYDNQAGDDKFPIYDDVYDYKVLTEPEHTLFSLRIAALHFKAQSLQ